MEEIELTLKKNNKEEEIYLPLVNLTAVKFFLLCENNFVSPRHYVISLKILINVMNAVELGLIVSTL